MSIMVFALTPSCPIFRIFTIYPFLLLDLSFFFPLPTSLQAPASLSFQSMAFECPFTLLSRCTTYSPSVSLSVFSQAQCRPWTKLGTSWRRAARISQTPSPPRPCAAHPAPPYWQGNMCTTTTPIPTMRTAPRPHGRPTMSHTRLLCTSTTLATEQVCAASLIQGASYT